MANRRAPGEYIQAPPNAAAHVDAYFEYRAIVGDDDGGQMFTPEEFEAYKKRVLPMRLHNRLYVSWVNPEGMDCILVGPQHKCLCRHRFTEHKTDFQQIPNDRPILLPCRASGCRCVSFDYAANSSGTSDPNCRCKHALEHHSTNPPYKCKKGCACSGFSTPFTCGCGTAANKHFTLVETAEEREKRGHPTGSYATPYKAMGGMTGFSSLAEGYLRLDESGRGMDLYLLMHLGRPSDEFLNQPITAADHPILRTHAALDPSSQEAQNQLRRGGESELDYYERRYKERVRERMLWASYTYLLTVQHLSKSVKAPENPYNSDAQLTTGSRKSGTSPQRHIKK
ncbi:unnamed protein product [Didymodactylos carnosus]|uniref:Protein FAM221A n=1 Tax=Didymodactylos carnosus TaxID=1234261 RepID=A0A8S2D1E0_9BILA|nr:unnamed protein product [Didymodactylos carnosus]CAF3562118.1 unnamed protein product [Didymodactylos carnosus]